MPKYDDQTRRDERAAERERLRPFLRQYLEAQGIDTSKNFRCLNPQHQDKHPSAYYTTGHRALCRACGAKYDIFDVIALEMGTESSNPRVFDEVRRRYDRGDFSFSQAATQPPRKAPAERLTAPQEDYTEFFRECAARISETDYPQRRGLTAETCKRFGLGFAPDWKHPSPKWYTHSPRLIIPASRSSYTARDTRPIEQIPENQRGGRNVKVGKANLYLQTNLYKPGAACIITEGELDAISVMQCGGSACALRSITNAPNLVRLLEQKPIPAGKALFLLLDADTDGQAAQERLAEELKRLGVPYACGSGSGYGIPDGLKDANDMLIHCPDKLREIVRACK